MNSALVIIDVQNFFVKEGTRDLPDKIATYIKKNAFDFVLFTVFINTQGSNLFRLRNWNKCTTPPDTDIHHTLSPYVTSNNVFEKTAFSAFKAKSFKRFLERNAISTLYLCGINTDACVLATAFDGFDLGYEIVVVRELCKSLSGKEIGDSALQIINKNIYKFKEQIPKLSI